MTAPKKMAVVEPADTVLRLTSDATRMSIQELREETYRLIKTCKSRQDMLEYVKEILSAGSELSDGLHAMVYLVVVLSYPWPGVK